MGRAVNPPFDRKLYVKLVYGAESAPTHEYIVEKSIEELNDVIKPQDKGDSQYNLAYKLFNLPLNSENTEGG